MIKKIKIFPKKNLLLFLVVFCAAFLFSGEANAATHTITEAMGNKLWTPTSLGAALSTTVRAGDKIVIAADRRTQLRFDNFIGTALAPYTITNPSNTVVTINYGCLNNDGGGGCTEKWDQAFRITNSDYVKVLGTSYADAPYGCGFVLDDTGTGATTISHGVFLSQVKNWEVAGIWAKNTGLVSQNANNTGVIESVARRGSWDETDHDGNPKADWVGYQVYLGDCSVHDCKATDTGLYSGSAPAEVTYLGNSNFSATLKFCQYDSMEIYNIIANNCGWDGIQVTRATVVNIHDNYINTTGVTTDDIKQNHGITGFVKSPTVSIYNNKIFNAEGNGIYRGTVNSATDNIYNNVIVNSGRHGISNMNSGMYVKNNTVVGSGLRGVNCSSYYANYNIAVGNASGQLGDTATKINNYENASISAAVFSNTAEEDYSLTANSPAKDIGTTTGYSSADIFGIPRPQPAGGNADAGAYEYTGNPSVPLAPQGLSVR